MSLNVHVLLSVDILFFGNTSFHTLISYILVLYFAPYKNFTWEDLKKHFVPLSVSSFYKIVVTKKRRILQSSLTNLFDLMFEISCLCFLWNFDFYDLLSLKSQWKNDSNYVLDIALAKICEGNSIDMAVTLPKISALLFWCLYGTCCIVLSESINQGIVHFLHSFHPPISATSLGMTFLWLIIFSNVDEKATCKCSSSIDRRFVSSSDSSLITPCRTVCLDIIVFLKTVLHLYSSSYVLCFWCSEYSGITSFFVWGYSNPMKVPIIFLYVFQYYYYLLEIFSTSY